MHVRQEVAIGLRVSFQAFGSGHEHRALTKYRDESEGILRRLEVEDQASFRKSRYMDLWILAGS